MQRIFRISNIRMEWILYTMDEASIERWIKCVGFDIKYHDVNQRAEGLSQELSQTDIMFLF